MIVSKSILIIKSQPRAISGVENFLRNRGWVISSTSNIKEALAFLVQSKPAFVLIATDHPVKKIRTLPRLINQAFPVCVIAYCEQSTTQAYKLLLDSGCEYKINPPITGPSVERMVNKFIKDQEMIEKGGHQDSHSSDSDRKASSSIVKGPQYFGSVKVDKGGGEDSAHALELAKSILREFDVEAEDSDSLAGSHVIGGEKAKASNIGYFPDQDKTGGQGDGSMFPIDPKSGKAAGSLMDSGSAQQEFNSKSGEAGPSRNQGFVPVYEEQDDSGGRGGGDGEQDSSKKAANEKDPSAISINDEEAKKASIRENLNQSIRRIGGNTGWDKSDSIIGRAAQKALDESVVSAGGAKANQIQQSSNVACIVVESPRFSGYLVAAMGKDRKIDGQFLKAIKDKLFKFLKEHGEEIKEEDNMDIKIKEVDFEDWSLEYADFLRKSVHNGEEIAMAFFPFADASAKLGDSAMSEMGSIKIDEIKGDQQIDFNLYIYLPANQRYVLYTPKGSKFYGNQKERLSKMGVTHLHMRKTETQDLSKYRAQNYLNSKIEEYEKKKKKGKKKSAS